MISALRRVPAGYERQPIAAHPRDDAVSVAFWVKPLSPSAARRPAKEAGIHPLQAGCGDPPYPFEIQSLLESLLLFDPTSLGSLNLTNRAVMAPMTRSRANGNLPNALMATYYA
jgi:hypothetical protein